ncbi:MAG: hypothetical protein U9Q15_00735, partial [Patescibacteria group bacterium]|nr:hypothetical protein [Patescibacteria group bacterium]
MYSENGVTDISALGKLSPGVDQEERKKKKVRTNIISAEDIDSLIYHLQLRSDRMRSVLILSPERMKKHAANKLLKILEEPGDNIEFCFYTNNISAVLPTIVSRCSVFPLNNSQDQKNDDVYLGDRYLQYQTSLLEQEEYYKNLYSLCQQWGSVSHRSDRFIMMKEFGKDVVSFYYFLNYLKRIYIPLLRKQDLQKFASVNKQLIDLELQAA